MVIVLGDRGHLTCVEARSGKARWQTRLPSGALRFYSSPVLSGTRLYCLASNGRLFTGQVSKEGFSDLRESGVEDVVVASPVVLPERLLIRGRATLYCFGPEPSG